MIGLNERSHRSITWTLRNLRAPQRGRDILPGHASSGAFVSNQPNKLAITAEGNRFEFFINDQLLNTLDDSGWSSGFVGIIIEV